ncbi:MAG: hypothetical protein M0R66_01345 [Candidatus Omnitrophica bacterium]|nr:hypothetical protein [Candidatus Omnitrophota bacterium]
MTDVYYKLEDASANSLIFVPTGYNEVHSRDMWEQSIPFVQTKWLLDQLTTSVEITQHALVKPGTASKPYASMKAALTAIRLLMPAAKQEAWTLKGGDWDGSTWTYNSDYPELPFGDYGIIQGQLSIQHNAGENFVDGDIMVDISMKLGVLY